MPDDDALLARVINFHELSRDAELEPIMMQLQSEITVQH
jgi:hypothetical protein